MVAGDPGKVIGDAIATIVAQSAKAALISAGTGAANAIGSAVGSSTLKIADDLRLLTKAMKKGFTDSGELTAMHDRIARQAQVAMLSSYRGKKTKRTFPTRGEFKGGALERALDSSNFYRVTDNKIEFGVTEFLDVSAKQWYRMNFGAGPRGSSTPPAGTHQIKFFNQNGGVLSLSEFGPSGQYNLPAGRFVGRDGRFIAHDLGRVGKDRFIISSNLARDGDGRALVKFPKPKPSLGFAGIMYLDAGIEQLAESFGLEWTDYTLKLFKEAAKQKSGALSGLVNKEGAAEQNAAIRKAAGRINGSLTELNSALDALRSGAA